ncbi:hypothetical protein GCM10023093_18440 [Nemorincola caseinilytica]|uniref:Uncharacterized protein n=1 Tax=Nemorincola caseinilytica TaxID=2054315 RepID=A0ABP8NH84_9BACT
MLYLSPPAQMDLYRIIPVLLHAIVLLRIGVDLYMLHSGVMTKADMAGINPLYDKFFYLVIFSTLASLFIGEKRLRLFSVITGVVAFAAIWFSAPVFTPEYHTDPMYGPVKQGDMEEEQEEEVE